MPACIICRELKDFPSASTEGICHLSARCFGLLAQAAKAGVLLAENLQTHSVNE